MKGIYKSAVLSGVLLTSLAACRKFDDINNNPNSTNTVTPALQATTLLLDITRQGADKNFVTSYMVSKHIAWGELAQGEQYNSFGRTGFDGIRVLTNVPKMIELAPEGEKNVYTALGTFIKAYKLFYLSMSLGDVPYTETLQTEQGNVKPKYDEQKAVMLQVLADLEKAEQLFTNAPNFGGDPTPLNGNSASWRRVVNAFRLKVLINLSKKEADADVKLKERFAQIAGSGQLLRSNADNFRLVYADKGGMLYPYNTNGTFKGQAYAMVTSVIVDTLKKLEDYRLFYYAAPSRYAVNTDKKAPDSWDAYRGTDPTLEFSTIAKIYTDGKHSAFNRRYTNLAAGEPVVRIGYAEQNFILAEAAARGWIAGDAKAFYEEGIKAAMNFIATATPDETQYHSGRKIDATYINTYLAGPFVKFAATQDEQLKQIWNQKYILYFMQHPWEAYYETRRTGYPVLPINPNTSLNQDDKNKMPVRWMYPQKEYDLNTDNVKAAIQRQFSGNDRTNELMWMLK